MPRSAFGHYMRKLRIDSQFTLRGFAERFGYDTAYISRLENNKLKPPSGEKLAILAKALGIKEKSNEWVTFFDLAYQARNELPPEVKEEAPEIISRLPAFLRTPDGKRISKKKIKKLIEFLDRQEEED